MSRRTTGAFRVGLVLAPVVITVTVAVAAIADVLNGQANLLTEAGHLVEFAGLVCLWMISGGPSRLPRHVGTVVRHLPLSATSRHH